MIDRLRALGELTPGQLVDACVDLLGPLPIGAATRRALLDFANKGGVLKLTPGNRAAKQRVGEMLALIVATREFQLV
jgi:hypothetical protein